jgi:hypothetical protein
MIAHQHRVSTYTMMVVVANVELLACRSGRRHATSQINHLLLHKNSSSTASLAQDSTSPPPGPSAVADSNNHPALAPVSVAASLASHTAARSSPLAGSPVVRHYLGLASLSVGYRRPCRWIHGPPYRIVRLTKLGRRCLVLALELGGMSARKTVAPAGAAVWMVAFADSLAEAACTLASERNHPDQAASSSCTVAEVVEEGTKGRSAVARSLCSEAERKAHGSLAPGCQTEAW